MSNEQNTNYYQILVNGDIDMQKAKQVNQKLINLESDLNFLQMKINEERYKLKQKLEENKSIMTDIQPKLDATKAQLVEFKEHLKNLPDYILRFNNSKREIQRLTDNIAYEVSSHSRSIKNQIEDLKIKAKFYDVDPEYSISLIVGMPNLGLQKLKKSLEEEELVYSKNLEYINCDWSAQISSAEKDIHDLQKCYDDCFKENLHTLCHLGNYERILRREMFRPKYIEYMVCHNLILEDENLYDKLCPDYVTSMLFSLCNIHRYKDLGGQTPSDSKCNEIIYNDVMSNIDLFNITHIRPYRFTC